MAIGTVENANGTALYRQPVRIQNLVTNVLTDFQVYLLVDYRPEMQLDFDDLFFADLGGTALSFWVESFATGVQAEVWARLDGK